MKTLVSIILILFFQCKIVVAQCPATANTPSNTCATGSTLSAAGSYSDVRRITTNTTIAGTVTIQNGGSLSICGSTSSFGALNLSNSTNTIIINAGATLTIGTTGTPSGNMTWDGTATIMNYGTLIINDRINMNNGNITFINAGIIQSNDNGGINIQTTSVFINRGTAQFRSVTTQRPNVIKIENGSSTTFNAYTHSDPNSGNSLPVIFCGTGSANTSFTGSVNVTNASNVFIINRNGQTVYACATGATYSPVGATSANLGSGLFVGNPNAAGAITGVRSICKPTTGITYSVAAITGATSYTWSVPTGASITAGAGTNSITVSFASNAISGTISAAGVNSCGTGTASTITVYPISCDIDGDGIANTTDLDDDNDGISDFVEACGVTATSFSCLTANPSADSDGDGLLNFRDPDYAAANGTTINANGVCTSLDTDGDGIINQYDLDSDNDGIPDVIEAFGVDANGDGRIDNFSDSNSDGLSDNVQSCTQRLTNPSFETPVQPSIGNNFVTPSSSFGGWYTQTGGAFNIIKTNGSAYGGGPNNAQNGTQYVDIINAADYFQQDITIVTATSNVSFGGYFSSREQSGGYINWLARAEILNSSGAIVATSATRNFTNADGAEDQIWYQLNGTATLAPGNYIFRVYIGDFGNFDNAYFNVCYSNLGAPDTDRDGIPNFLDIDSDDDGITDVREALGADSNNDGLVDGFTDTDSDGFSDNIDGDVGNDGVAENTANAILRSGADSNGDGRADSWPFDNQDASGYPNPYDIDSDNDGITDNVEAQATSSYRVPNDIDTDGDGLIDLYEVGSQVGLKTGAGLTPVDTDIDGIPDYLDTNSDGDALLDIHEGFDRNQPTFASLTQAVINASGDNDGDGLMNIFDNVNNDALSSNYFINVTMGNMGASGGFDGPTPSGSLIGLVMSNPLAADRDWRNSGYAILPLNIFNFTVNYQSPIVNIKWDVVNELQTSFYEVEVSYNGSDFKAHGTVNAQNTNKATYNFVHHILNNSPLVIYYRIKQVDKNGMIFYTSIATLKLQGKADVRIHNNPFTTSLGITYNALKDEILSIQMCSANGKIVSQQNKQVQKGVNYFNLSNLGNLSNGSYFLKIQSLTSTHQFQVVK